MAGVLPFGQVAARNHLRLAAGTGIDQKGGQNAGNPRQFHRGSRRLGMVDRFGEEGPLQRIVEVECRIGDDPRADQVNGLCRADQDRRLGHGGLTLVGQLERDRAGGGDQHPVSPGTGGEAGFSRQQAQHAIDLYRPAVAQRIKRQRNPAGGSQRSNSVIRGT